MSKIMDLYAVENGIEDLMPPKSTYDKAFADKVKQSDEERAVRMIFEKGRYWVGAKDWFKDKAEFGCGYDDEGHKEIYFENFTELCEHAAMELTDHFIFEQHFDMDDEQYDRITNKVGDLLANHYADLESEIIEDYKEERDECYKDLQSYNEATLPKD